MPDDNDCLICGCTTVQRGMFDICPMCCWKDDGDYYLELPAEPSSGPNYELSLNKARQDVEKYKHLLPLVIHMFSTQ
jgi:hypothetical protein